MNRKALVFSLATVAGLTFSTIGAEAQAAAEPTILSQNNLDTKKEEIAKQIKIYDENGFEIQPYTLEELKSMITLSEEKAQFSTYSSVQSDSISTLATDYRVYTSTAFSFKYNIWLGGGLWGKAFKDPAQLFVTSDGTAKAMKIVAAKDVSGTHAGDTAGSVSLPGGWTGEIHMSWSHLTRGKSYRFNFVNSGSSSVTVKVKKATVWYD